MRTYRNHRGVKIYRIKTMVTGSDFDMIDDQVVSRTPKYDITFKYAGSAEYDSLQECKDAIDGLITRLESVVGEADVEILNEGEI